MRRLISWAEQMGKNLKKESFGVDMLSLDNCPKGNILGLHSCFKAVLDYVFIFLSLVCNIAVRA